MQLPNGSQFAIASTYGASKTMSAVSNADPAVATLEASHGIATGELFEVTSGWNAIDQRVVRAGTVSVNDVPLEGINSSNTTRFPAGSGVGSAREISAWTAITQILNAEISGGDQSFYQYLFVDDPSFTQKQMPTFRGAMSMGFRLADDMSKPWYGAIKAASESRTNYALRIVVPNGNIILLNGIWTMNEMPTFVPNEGMALDVSFSLQSMPTRYAS